MFSYFKDTLFGGHEVSYEFVLESKIQEAKSLLRGEGVDSELLRAEGARLCSESTKSIDNNSYNLLVKNIERAMAFVRKNISLTEELSSVMELCKIWKESNGITFTQMVKDPSGPLPAEEGLCAIRDDIAESSQIDLYHSRRKAMYQAFHDYVQYIVYGHPLLRISCLIDDVAFIIKGIEGCMSTDDLEKNQSLAIIKKSQGIIESAYQRIVKEVNGVTTAAYWHDFNTMIRFVSSLEELYDHMQFIIQQLESHKDTWQVFIGNVVWERFFCRYKLVEVLINDFFRVKLLLTGIHKDEIPGSVIVSGIQAEAITVAVDIMVQYIFKAIDNSKLSEHQEVITHITEKYVAISAAVEKYEKTKGKILNFESESHKTHRREAFQKVLPIILGHVTELNKGIDLLNKEAGNNYMKFDMDEITKIDCPSAKWYKEFLIMLGNISQHIKNKALLGTLLDAFDSFLYPKKVRVQYNALCSELLNSLSDFFLTCDKVITSLKDKGVYISHDELRMTVNISNMCCVTFVPNLELSKDSSVATSLSGASCYSKDVTAAASTNLSSASACSKNVTAAVPGSSPKTASLKNIYYSELFLCDCYCQYNERDVKTKEGQYYSHNGDEKTDTARRKKYELERDQKLKID